MKCVAFIFARGGSKGLPGKNIKRLAGKPLITYSIETALSCDLISEVYVSTDDAAIAEIACDAGASIINRPSHLATDDAPELLAWRHAVHALECEGKPFDLFVSLPPTSPLRSTVDVANAIQAMKSDRTADICITISKASRNPYFNMVESDGKGGFQLAIKSSGEFSRRQDSPPLFDITTVAYIAKPEYIKSHSTLFSGRVIGVEVPKERAVDIDDILDFEFAELLVNRGINAKN